MLNGRSPRNIFDTYCSRDGSSIFDSILIYLFDGVRNVIVDNLDERFAWISMYKSEIIYWDI